jgi:hypothetical protein
MHCSKRCFDTIKNTQQQLLLGLADGATLITVLEIDKTMKIYFLLTLLAFAMSSHAQKTGSVSYTINITSVMGGTVVQNAVQPYTKYTNYNAYWFTKPNGERYVMINGGKDLGIVILHNPENDADIVYQDKYQGDQLNLEGSLKGKKFICYPDNDKGPVHIHYNTFTAGELEFTFTGPVKFGLSADSYVKGNINGVIHLYRDAVYEKSATAPNCNCDPTIYASFYDPEIGRTPSACENVVLWRVYNALHPALNPLVDLAITGNGPAAYGSIIYRKDNSMIDVTEPVEPVDACDPNNKRRGIVSTTAHLRLFRQDNYSLNFIQMVNTDQFVNKKVDMKALLIQSIKFQDSVMKLVMAKKISSAEASKQVNANTDALKNTSQQGMPDIHQAEVYAHLDVAAKVNMQQSDIRTDGGQLEQTVTGAAFELYKSSVKDGDGNWSPFVRYVGFGKFNIIKVGNQVKSIVPVYPPGANKLTLFNVVIEIKGGKDLIDTATRTINFAALPAMLTNN